MEGWNETDPTHRWRSKADAKCLARPRWRCAKDLGCVLLLEHIRVLIPAHILLLERVSYYTSLARPRRRCANSHRGLDVRCVLSLECVLLLECTLLLECVRLLECVLLLGAPMRIALLTWESLHTIAVGGVAPHVTELAAGVDRVCV